MNSGEGLDIEVGTRELQSTSRPIGPPEETAGHTFIPKGFNLKRVPTQQTALLLSCVAAAILDPLFFYIPSINGGSICLESDRNLGIIVIILRSLADVLYSVLWSFHWRTRRGTGATASQGEAVDTRSLDTASAEKTQSSPGKTVLSSPKTAVEMSPILPLTQATAIAIVIMRGNPRLLQAVMVIKFSVFIQFILRATVLVPLCHKTMENSRTLFKFRFWVGAGFNLMCFVLASHFVGAFWYLLSVERTLDCWRSACRSHGGCNPDSLYCGGSVGNKSYLNDYCSPGKTSNTPAFDFGIYLSAIESNIVASTRFTLKFTYCFWWGLRNLSSLGQNLDNSAYEWELCFSICISIIGLILVSLFIGNMQAYFQFRTQVQLEKMDKKEKKTAKIGKRLSDLLNWETFQWLPPDLRRDIKACEEDKWLETNEVDLPTAVNSLPQEIGGRIIPALCTEMQSRVKAFQALTGTQKFENRVRPKVYHRGEHLFRKKDPVGEIVIILRGTLNVHAEDNQPHELGPWDVIGEELLKEIITSSRKSYRSSLSHPLSRVDVRATKKVDALLISAKYLRILMKDVDLKSILANISPHLSKEIKLHFCLPILSKLPALEKVHREAREAFCERAMPVSFSLESVLVQDDSDINKMFIIVSGRLRSYDKKDGSQSKECFDKFLGQELLQQALSPDASDNLKPPVSPILIRTLTKVEAFRLMAPDIRTVHKEWLFMEERAKKVLMKYFSRRQNMSRVEGK
ncbi:hypothetical protein MLD38_002935 [Melastoma candidum]|uniref:Uncharacterized protein n=1 Tax=Melastoma candidum TaxID=119954 RepID=A0ACB9S2I2_9MYRT|nr:hypothetical protein MLD38_002935 [Melastoma candidum]